MPNEPTEGEGEEARQGRGGREQGAGSRERNLDEFLHLALHVPDIELAIAGDGAEDC